MPKTRRGNTPARKRVPRNELSDTERARLAVLVQDVTNAFQAMETAGDALIEIHDKKLWRGSHKTFAAFVEDHWSVQRSEAYRILNSQRLATKLGVGDQPQLTRHVKRLLDVPEERQTEAWGKVVEVIDTDTGEVLTGSIRETIRPYTTKPKTAKELEQQLRDATKTPVETAPGRRNRDEATMVSALLKAVTELDQCMRDMALFRGDEQQDESIDRLAAYIKEHVADPDVKAAHAVAVAERLGRVAQNVRMQLI